MKMNDLPMATQIDPKEFAASVLMLLQDDPSRYRLFGVWWWPVKAILRHLYAQDNLYMLGAYEDPDGAARVPKLPLQETLAEAVEEYRRNAFEGGNARSVTDPQGGDYVIFDADAGV